jgi:cardiolipin synthase
MNYWPMITTGLAYVATLALVPMILARKRQPASAIAWSLTIIVIPLLGTVTYFFFGHDHIERPLRRKQTHRQRFRRPRPGDADPSSDSMAGQELQQAETWENMHELAARVGASPLTEGNRVDLYGDGESAYWAKLEAIGQAQHHIHMEYFIFQPDAAGGRFIDALAEKARAGVEVRLLYDAVGSFWLHKNFLKPLKQAGARCEPFLPIHPLRRRIQINLRNHRKLLLVDGQVGFIGGLNIGDEYLGQSKLGFWRDSHMRIEGPAVRGLQDVFVEDWDFAAGTKLDSDAYFPPLAAEGSERLQMIWSGPDQAHNAVREIFFAAATNANTRLWIATPYFVPDDAFIYAIRSAAHVGADVRIITQNDKPDKRLPLWASKYYWPDLWDAGVRIYQYRKGMMHAKVMIADDDWATLGTANMDNRSMRLNFEVNTLIYSRPTVDALIEQFQHDLDDSVEINPDAFARQSRPQRLVQNAARLLSPVL